MKDIYKLTIVKTSKNHYKIEANGEYGHIKYNYTTSLKNAIEYIIVSYKILQTCRWHMKYIDQTALGKDFEITLKDIPYNILKILYDERISRENKLTIYKKLIQEAKKRSY